MVVLLPTFIRDDIPSKLDLGWLAPDGAIFGGREGLSPRFDAGEKFSFGWAGCFSARWRSAPALSWGQMGAQRRFHPRHRQIAEIVHVSATAVLVAMFFADIYLGAIDVGGSPDGTRYVDERCVKQHRALWLDRSNAGKVPAQRLPKASVLTMRLLINRARARTKWWRSITLNPRSKANPTRPQLLRLLV